MSGFYVLDVPEFLPLLEAARRHALCQVHPLRAGYSYVAFDEPIELLRAATGLQPAVWFGCLTAGLDAKITAFTADALCLTPTNEPII
jgi:hypothetical protein